MEGMPSDSEKQRLISSFLEIAVGQTAETASQFLLATRWKLDEAIQLFYVGNEGGVIASTSLSLPKENVGLTDVGNENVGQVGGEEVRPPLPVVRDILYDDAMFYGAPRMGFLPLGPRSMIALRNFNEDINCAGVWHSDQGATSTSDNPRDNLASLYRPPFHLMFHGPFEKAKSAASVQDKWLLVNLQSTKEFNSHMLNRDTWANEAVAQTISTNFIFWQVYDDTNEGRKVCTYYKLDSIPVVLVVDPITGQKMRSWFGMVQPESLLEDIIPFMDGGPRDHYMTFSHKRPRGNFVAPNNSEDETVALASVENMKQPSAVSPNNEAATTADKDDETCSTEKAAYPPLPEEPKCDRSLLCRVGVRLPDGCRVQRNFLKTDPIQLLWSFCYSLLEEAGTRQFRLTEAIPGAKNLDYNSKLTFGESGLANSMISVAWE